MTHPLTDLHDLGERAYVFGLPTIDLYRILDSFALDPSSPEFKAPLGQFAHSRRLADPSDRSIVAMNVDTPYSYAWLDLRDGPVVLTLPAFEPGRYVAAELFDLYTYIVGYVSPRTNGTRGGSFLITGPGQMAEDVELPAFACPTQLCLVLVRTQLLGDADLPNVAALQDQMHVQPLGDWLGRADHASDPAPGLVPIAPVDVRARPTVQALRVLAWMLRFMPPLPEHADVRAALATVGIGGGDLAQLGRVLADPARVAQLEAGLADGLDDVLARARRVRSSAEIFGSRELLGHDDLARAAGAYLGILGNAAEEYLGVGYQADANGSPFDGSTAYTITFPPGGLPPVDAFWSITLYDADRFLYPNDLNRYLLGSRDLPRMHRDEDGSLTLIVQHTAPRESLLGNWLPCPQGTFHLAFRTYQPGEAIRNGTWQAPPVARRTTVSSPADDPASQDQSESGFNRSSPRRDPQMSAAGAAHPDTRVLEELSRGLQAAGFNTKVLVDPLPEVVVLARDPRLDPWEDPDPDRQIEVVRIQHLDGQLYCPWLPGPVADSEVDEVGSMLKTLMDSRGY